MIYCTRKRGDTLKEAKGRVFSIAESNPPIPGCTVSFGVADGIDYYSLAAGTDISAEIYTYHKLILVSAGCVEVYYEGRTATCRSGEGVFTPTDTPVGVRTDGGAVYTEIAVERSSVMNSIIKSGEAFELKKLVPYQIGRIVNMDIVHNDKMKFVVMAFDEGTGLSEHAAPGEAMIFALDGEGIIGYEGEEHVIKAGENFCFAKGGRHWVKAKGRFKMALLLTLD